MFDVQSFSESVLLGLRPILEPVFGLKPEERSDTLRVLAERNEGSVPNEAKWARDFESDLKATRPKLRPTREYGGGTRIVPNETLNQADVIHQEILQKVEAKRRAVVLTRAQCERMRMGLIDEEERKQQAERHNASNTRSTLGAKNIPTWNWISDRPIDTPPDSINSIC